jgi:two-component system chemotaxis response regulator CheY
MEKTILIVDDFENTLFVTAFTLEMAKYKVLKASSVKQALSVLADNLNVDLIITDYNMPEINGLEFVEMIKKIPVYFKVPIFVLSTEKSDEIKKSAVHKGVTAWIQKPFHAGKLVDYVKKTIGE